MYHKALSTYLKQMRLFNCAANVGLSPFARRFHNMSVDLNNNCPEGSGSIRREHNLLAASARNMASQFLA